MDESSRDQNIKSIIRLEDRVGQCSRCLSLTMCTSRPSRGKGDLEPQVFLVFECENSFTRDTNWLIELRNKIKQEFNIERVYHTFMVRCHPKACSNRQSYSCIIPGKMLGRDNICKLSRDICDGIPIKPSGEVIINCLTYLLEEMDILKPSYVVLFGKKVRDYVLKSCGGFEALQTGQPYEYKDMVFLSTVEETSLNEEEVQNLGRIIAKS
ncbi:MAG: hypothetical protein CVU90_05675 [Firmicutes bacterium HGW-Firmicutes-15]|nr:MAG: hypothetical protein CVU90_05675 [Firmicutes bacterium HGW-Firmicutes-15]